MRMVREQSKDWIKSFCEWYNKNQNILFESFIAFYGEDERETIIEEIDNIPFLFILSDVAYLNCKNVPEDSFAKKLIAYFRHNNLVLDTLARKGAGNIRILNEAIKASMIDKYPRGSFEYFLHRGYIEEPSNGVTHFDSDGTNPIIILPIYFVNDRIIFHEINHVLTTPKRRKDLFPSVEVDELLNELASRDILRIFKSLGGKILPYELDLGDEYKDNLFLMRDFYERFKDLIKKCTRNGDIRILKDNLGDYNLALYFALVKKLYHKKYITDIDIKRINFLIWQMEEYQKTKRECYNRIRLRKLEK